MDRHIYQQGVDGYQYRCSVQNFEYLSEFEKYIELTLNLLLFEEEKSLHTSKRKKILPN